MTIEEFRQVDLRVAKIVAAERVEGSEKLLKLTMDAGDKDAADLPAGRQVVAGIAKSYAPEELVGKSVIVVVNLDPRIFKIPRQSAADSSDPRESASVAYESNGMLLAASDAEGKAVILVPDREVETGTKIT